MISHFTPRTLPLNKKCIDCIVYSRLNINHLIVKSKCVLIVKFPGTGMYCTLGIGIREIVEENRQREWIKDNKVIKEF